MEYLWAFVIGGIWCIVGQLLLDGTKLTAPRILVIFVVTGVVLQALNLYQPIVDLAGNGATVPLPGFGYNLAKGVTEEIDKSGFLGIFTGGLKAAAGGISGAVVFSWIAAMIFEPKEK